MKDINYNSEPSIIDAYGRHHFHLGQKNRPAAEPGATSAFDQGSPWRALSGSLRRYGSTGSTVSKVSMAVNKRVPVVIGLFLKFWIELHYTNNIHLDLLLYSKSGRGGKNGRLLSAKASVLRALHQHSNDSIVVN